MKAHEQFVKGFEIASDMRGYKQKDVAERAGISVMTLRRFVYDRTDIKLTTLENLCVDGLGLSLSTVFALGEL